MYLGFNRENGRYGLLSGDLWVNDGLHCGQSLEVDTDDGVVLTRLEMDANGEWYLIGTSWSGSDLEGLRVHIPGQEDVVKY